jgi:hypothetical protein
MVNNKAIYDLPLKADIIQIIIMITTITEIIPTAAPALKIPPITSHPLKVATANASNNKFNFFMVYSIRFMMYEG